MIHLEEIRSRTRLYKDEQAKADVTVLLNAVDHLLEEKTTNYHTKDRMLHSIGIEVYAQKSEVKEGYVWKAFSECGSEFLDDFQLKIGTKWSTINEAIDIIIDVGTQIGIEWMVDPTEKPILVYVKKEQFPPPPNFIKILKEQSKRINFVILIDEE